MGSSCRNPTSAARSRSVNSKRKPCGLEANLGILLGEPVSVLKRCAAEGMPVRREGQFVATSSDELNAWLSRDSGKPAHVATENTDLTAELKRGLAFVRHREPLRSKPPSGKAKS